MTTELEFAPTKSQCCTAQIHAQNLSEHLLLAYWMDGRADTARDHHRKEAGEKLQALCAELGFKLSPIPSEELEKAA